MYLMIITLKCETNRELSIDGGINKIDVNNRAMRQMK
jgi:hypothetical protein